MMKSAKNVCRTCMDETGTLVDIFANVRDPVLDEPEMSLSHILARCTDRPVKRGDLLPQFICVSCVVAVQNAFRFKWQSEQSYQHFLRVLNQSSSPENQVQLAASNEDENQTQKMLLKSDRQQDKHQMGKTQQSEDDPSQKQTLQTELQEKNEDGLPEPFTPQRRKRTCRTEDHQDIIPKESPRSTKMMIPQVRCDADGYYNCPQCSKRFSSQTKLRTHISDQCNRCPYCPLSYMHKANLKRHLQNHLSKPEHKCGHCSKAFVRKDHLKRHLRTHDSDGPLSCSQCSAVFIEYAQLEIHRREHKQGPGPSKSESTKEPDSEDSDQAEDLNPKCTKNTFNGTSSSPTMLKPIVDDSHFAKENLNNHNIFTPRGLRGRELKKRDEVLSGTTQDEGDRKKKEKPKCDLCLKKFSSVYALKRHMLTHNRQPDIRKCTYCSEEFHTEEHLKRHERGHTGDLFRCEFCSLVFVDVNYLQKHKKRIHSNNVIAMQKIMSKRMTTGFNIEKQPLN
ncbi:uncharacterized zinc finger protein CG2678 [Drosophila mauritiana]|uniref:Uncharacterized zinc finger protein CG2678 n=1 Tax=Drosophila mauritiana TaxID=7226 RepID=A0A6P8K0Q9_DROMA|nr:uncharacterized zinc finger protein CG2678 [Drosophila mauritiana]